MLTKILALFASFLLLFQFTFPAQEPIKESGEILMENIPITNENRTYDRIDGVNGSVFYIERPSSDALSIVHGADFGISEANEDNFAALQTALDHCRANPGTKLVLAPGTYYLKNTSPLNLGGCKDTLIDGNGAKLIFSQVTNGMELSGCDCVEFRNILFDWDWEKLPLSDVVTVQNADKKNNTLDFVFERSGIAENMVIAAVSQCDPETLTYGAKYSNKEVYVYMDPDALRSVTKTADNILHIQHNGCFNNFADGEKFILRHYVYDSTFAAISGGSRNVTFDGVSVFGWPGSGFYAGGEASHFQVIHSYIGVEPGMEKLRHTSLGADAIHIVNTRGCFRIADCDISRQGDDALNVHDGLGWVKSVEGSKVTMLGNAILLRIGDTLHFRDELFNDTDINAVITGLVYHQEGTYYDLEFDRDLNGIVKSDYIAYSTEYDSGNYVVQNNYFHENRARGLLLQSSNGLCENNRFYKTEMQAIKVIMDISPGLWYEGKGVDDLVIRNNTFDFCDYIATGEVITVGSNIDGKTAVSQPFTNVFIIGNRFTEFPERVANINNANGLVFNDNEVDAGTEMPKMKTSARAFFGRYCSHITWENNVWKNCILGELAAAKTPAVWARINAEQGPVC